MFGRRRSRRSQEVQFAQATIDSKYALIDGVQRLLDAGTWFEDGEYEAGKLALSDYLRYLSQTDDVVFLTVNSLSPTLDARARQAADTVASIMLRPVMPGLGKPYYLAHNALQRDIFDVDPFEGPTADLNTADGALAYGFMEASQPEFFASLEACLQQLTVACVLAAGWAQSPQRARLVR